MPQALLLQLEECARAGGFDLLGLVDAHRFDATQPYELRCAREMSGCGTVIVVACGGSAPTEWAALRELQPMVQRAGYRAQFVEPTQGRLRLAALGEAAGLGTVSPVIHRLLHPMFGPRVIVGGAVLVEGQPFGPIADKSIAEHFQPCCNCPRPCLSTCPSVLAESSGHVHVDATRCTRERQRGACANACGVIRNCPVGAGQALPQVVESERHRYELARDLAIQGRGVWPAIRRWIGWW